MLTIRNTKTLGLQSHGSIGAFFVPTALIQPRTSLATNPGPLSLRTNDHQARAVGERKVVTHPRLARLAARQNKTRFWIGTVWRCRGAIPVPKRGGWFQIRTRQREKREAARFWNGTLIVTTPCKRSTEHQWGALAFDARRRGV